MVDSYVSRRFPRFHLKKRRTFTLFTSTRMPSACAAWRHAARCTPGRRRSALRPPIDRTRGCQMPRAGAVLQSTAGSCVAACGEMLSGGAMSQAEFLAQLGEWSNPGALAEALNALAGVTTWEGGYFASAADAVVAAQAGQMGVVLQAPFLPAHMVILEPGEAGMFLVRDPAIGGTYEVAVDWITKYVAGGVW